MDKGIRQREHVGASWNEKQEEEGLDRREEH